MPCVDPMPAVRTTQGGLSLRKIREEREPGDYVLWLPCGTCVGCQLRIARDWAIRCHYEHELHTDAAWTTLTYNNHHEPPTLTKPHLQGFLKRLRARVHPARIRFLASGEYGERTGRPHYHAILFGVPTTAPIQEAWPYGHAWIADLTPERIAYTAGYTAKKVGLRADKLERIDYSTGEVYTFQPAFLQMSRRPGIGGDARKYHRDWRRTALYQGAEYPAPRFLHEAWRRQATAEAIHKLEQEKIQEQLQHTTTDNRTRQQKNTAQHTIHTKQLQQKRERQQL